MIQVTPQMRILLAAEPVYFRKGINGLAKVCRVIRDLPASVLNRKKIIGYAGAHNKKDTRGERALQFLL